MKNKLMEALKGWSNLITRKNKRNQT